MKIKVITITTTYRDAVLCAQQAARDGFVPLIVEDFDRQEIIDLLGDCGCRKAPAPAELLP